MEVVVLVIVLIIIILLIFIYNISIYPFVRGFRFINKYAEVRLDIYKERIKDIKEESVKVKVKDCPDVGITFYSPNTNFEKLPVIVFIHGGGWVGGSAKKIAPFTKLLSSNGYVVASIEYSLAPEWKYPISTFQLVETLNYIYQNADKYKIDNTKIYIGGTSAGAHLSSQLGCLVSNEEYMKKVGVKVDVPNSSIKGLLLINGIYNFDTVGKCHFPGMKRFIWAYVGKRKYLEYEKIDELSSIKYITKDYPTVFITVGDKDPLRTQTCELVEVLKKNKIKYVTKFFDDCNLPHDFIYLLDKDESRNTYEEIVKFLNNGN